MRPTNFWPGSPEKVEVLRKRASTFLCLWHPQDAKLPRLPEKMIGSLPSPLVADGTSEDVLALNYQRFLRMVVNDE